MANIIISPSKYVQGAGELANVAEYAVKLGKKAFILISASGIKRVGGIIEESFKGTDATFMFETFNGECCKKEIDRLVAIVKENGCDLVIGAVCGGPSQSVAGVAGSDPGLLFRMGASGDRQLVDDGRTSCSEQCSHSCRGCGIWSGCSSWRLTSDPGTGSGQYDSVRAVCPSACCRNCSVCKIWKKSQ